MMKGRGLVVGLSGKFGAGKDTAATLLQESMPEMNWKRISFAHLVKATVATLTSTTMEANLSDEGKQTVPRGFSHTLGTLQQRVGMAMREHVDANVWVQAAFASVEPGDNVLVTDVRFPNELAEIQQVWHGIVIRLEGRAPRAEERRDPNHPSETALDGAKFDVVIQNTGTLEELREALMKAIKFI
jgi:hypothetical protein